MLGNKAKIYNHLILLLVILAVIWRDCAVLFQTSLPVGVDGYYYVLQIDSLRNSGRFYFETSTPFILYFFGGLSLFLDDPILSIKVGSLLLFVLLIVGVYWIVVVTTERCWAGLFAVTIAALSNLHFFYIGEFLKNLGALVFILFGILSTLKFNKTRKKIWLLPLILALSAAIFSHRSAIFLIAVLFFATAVTFLCFKYGKGIKAIMLSLCALSFIFPLLLSHQTIIDVPAIVKVELADYPTTPFSGYGLPEKWMLIVVICLFVSQLDNFSSIIQKNRSL